CGRLHLVRWGSRPLARCKAPRADPRAPLCGLRVRRRARVQRQGFPFGGPQRAPPQLGADPRLRGAGRMDDLAKATQEVISSNNIVDGYVRPVAWRGAEQMGVSAQASKIHLALAAWEWPAYFSPEARARGIRMKWANWARPAPHPRPTEAKAAGLYMICTLSKHMAEADGFDDALMLDWRGRLAEGTGANIFLVINGELHTPTPDCFLYGIT